MNSVRPEKMIQEKACNCRNSKCMKLYCQCFSAGQECSKNCRCFDCHNQKDKEQFRLLKPHSSVLGPKILATEANKVSKGCSCRKSFCVKKYCECFQDGVLCSQTCKCIQCQNNESMTNRSVIQNLKQSTSNTSNKQCSLYPIVLSQTAQHLNSILNEDNLLEIDDLDLQEDIAEMSRVAEGGNAEPLLANFISILRKIDRNSRSQKSQMLKRELSE